MSTPISESIVDFDDPAAHLFIKELIRRYLSSFIEALDLPNGPRRVHKINSILDTVTKEILQTFTFPPQAPTPSLLNARVGSFFIIVDTY
jgi:hypothetical protein